MLHTSPRPDVASKDTGDRDSLPAQFPHTLRFIRWVLYLPCVKLEQILQKPPRKTNLEKPDAFASGCCPFMLGHDELHTNFYSQEENGLTKATKVLQQRDNATQRAQSRDQWRCASAVETEPCFLCAHTLEYPTVYF